MREYLQFYIDGKWVDPVEPKTPRRHQSGDRRGRRPDLRWAPPPTWTRPSPPPARRSPAGRRPRREERLEVLLAHPGRVPEALRRHRRGDHRGDGRAAVAGADAPRPGSGIGHSRPAIEVLKSFKFEEHRGTTMIVKEPIGVCGLITPWNWPMNQIGVQGGPGAGDRLHHGPEAAASWRRTPPRSSPRCCTRPASRPACSTWSRARAAVSARR